MTESCKNITLFFKLSPEEETLLNYITDIRRIDNNRRQILIGMFEDITTGIPLDYKYQNKKLKHFYSMLGVVKVNKQNNFYIKADISVNTFQKPSSE